ncbi:hypothetical protein BGW36DRAFT_369464 [Talaromyces proteolyticus]|uniref:Uncharacterized protein n=1 Tax=Talaromyces proteolyticus TaxID=1131652 RepID=A0AAD4Q4V6_9EURO|nr:uncharacterized protein BGW36DRAFT_369464 [Talaromyces proteolyticus]KAH8703519.1 hypothetical protein BGW36DRAFT_369464 [Talaromyces proteolyticus]
MMQFEVAAVDPADSGDLHSPPSHSSGRQVSYSTVNDKGKEVENLPRNGNALQSNGFVASRSFQPSTMVKPEPLNRQLSGPDTNIGTSLSAVSSLSNDDNYKLSLDISEPLSKRPSSLVPREISIGSPGGTKQTNFQSTARGSSLEVPRKLAVVSSTLPAPNPPGNNQHSSPRIHHISRFYQSKDSTNEPNLNFAFEKTIPVDNSARSPVSPPLPETENAPTSDSNRRFSSSSQVSDISEDDMDRIREKFDEDGLYTKFRDPSPTGSKVSALSEDEDDDVDAALEEKLAEVGYHEDPQKDLPTQPARRAQAPRRQSQPISVVRISRFPQDRRISQSAESNKRLSRHSRFSFESDRHAIAEAMLVTGYRKPILIDSSQEQEVSTQIPVTLGEEAPDEPPPPFENPAAPYSADNKEVNENETTPTYDPRRDSQADTRRPSASTTLPQYQPIESLSPNHEPTWRKSQLPEPQTHRDSHRSSVSSLSNTVANTQGPRTTISPEPQPSQSSNQVSFNSNIQKSKAKDAINAVSRLGKSRWTDGRLAAGAHSRPLSGDSGPPTGSSNFFGPGRREEDSLGSGDSMAVQAALSRHDLRMDPSPLNQESETASATSGKSFKLSVPFKNRIKFVGKRARGSSIDAPSVDSNAESKMSLDMSKDSEKNPEAKRGAFSKITGMFNRSSLGQPVEGKHRVSQDAPSVNSQHRENQRAAHRANTWTVPAPHQYAQQQPSSYPSSQQQPQPATLTSHNKGLPPPPSGYYAPQPSPPTESLHGHSSQGYSYHPDNIGTYRPYPENHYPIKSPHSVYSPEQRNSGSSHSYSVGSPMSGIPSTPWQKPSSPEPLERGRSRAQDLRLRSRSPVSQTVSRRTVDRFDGNVNYSDPIYNLGKFNAVTETSRIGDQSTPFPITLPEGMEKDPLSPRNSIQPEPMAYNRKTSNAGLGLLQSRTTVHSIAAATAVANVAREAVSNNPPALSIPEESKPTFLSNSHSEASRYHPTDGQAPESTPYYDDRSVIAKNSVPVELPVPRDDDSEEIVMSSTAYPGQEWQPSGYENWMMPY